MCPGCCKLLATGEVLLRRVQQRSTGTGGTMTGVAKKLKDRTGPVFLSYLPLPPQYKAWHCLGSSKSTVDSAVQELIPGVQAAALDAACSVKTRVKF